MSRISRIRERAQILLLLGVGWIVYGLSRVMMPWPPDRQGDALFHHAVPSWLYGAVWIAAGLVMLATPAWAHRTRFTDGIGYAVALIPPYLTAASFLIGWVVWLLPLRTPGARDGWGSAVVWLVIASWLLVDSRRRDELGSATGGDAENLAP